MNLQIKSSMNNSAAIELTGKLTVVALVILFLVVLSLLFLHFYAKWFYYLRQEESFTITTTRRVLRRRRRFDFGPDSSIEEGTAGTGLDPTVLESIPTLVFDPTNCKPGIDCAVCLSDLAAGEEARMLPKCNHGFHVNCIDTWFQSHSTCPICRNPVSVPTLLPESSRFPTNVLFYGHQNEICRVGVVSVEEDDRRASTCVVPSQQPPICSSSSSAQSVVIDIHAKASEDDETKLPARLRPMKRVLSRDKRLNPCISGVDAEQIDQVQS